MMNQYIQEQARLYISALNRQHGNSSVEKTASEDDPVSANVESQQGSRFNLASLVERLIGSVRHQEREKQKSQAR